MSITAPPPRRPAADRIALCRAILSSGRPDDDHTAALASAALDGTPLEDLMVLDVTGFGIGRAAA